MNKLKVYVDQNSTELFKKYEGHLKDCKATIFFIGEDYDVDQLKIELNHVVARGSDLICVLSGNPEFDSGISMQMGLATIIKDSADGPFQLESLLSQNAQIKPKAGLIIAILAIVILVAAAVLILPKLKKEEEVPSAENLKLDEVYTKALIDAGADCIVIDGGVSKEEMLSLEALDLSSKGISDITPLLYATNLKELDLSNNNITDITELAALGKLEKVDLSNNPIENYAVLDYLPNLNEINK